MVIALFAIASGSHCFALSVDEGFDNIPWGSSFELVEKEAAGTFQNKKKINYRTWNNSAFAKYTKGILAPKSSLVTYTGKYAEVTQYYFSNDKLCLVIHRPPYTKSFDASGYVQFMELKLNRAPSNKYRGTIPFPGGWGRYNMKTEYPLTVEWENDLSLVRVAVEAWPLEELREIKNVVYASKKLMAENQDEVQLLEFHHQEHLKKIAEEKAKAKLAEQKAIEALQ